jgi:hypothetical protein
MQMITTLLLAAVPFSSLAVPGESQDAAVEAAGFSGMSYLDNGIIRIGANLDRGGAITWLSKSEGGINVVNDFDLGRQIQMSFYSGPNPYEPEGKKPAESWAMLGWNPIQSGDFADHRSRVLAHENDGEEIFVRCVPMHWPLDDEPAHCVFESRIRIEGNRVRVRSGLLNDRRDRTQYPARGQELPAVYTNGFLHRLITYTGDQPFTGGETTTIEKRWSTFADRDGKSPWASWVATEGWAALLDDEGWGLGIFSPENLFYSGGFFGEPGSGGPKDSQTGYFSPVQREVLDAEIRYFYEYTLILGSLEEIRSFACAHPPASRPPAWRFEKDRRHWHYRQAHDAGWPIEGELVVTADGPKARLVGPVAFWRAAEMPRLRIEAAFDSGEEQATIRWMRHGESGSREGDALVFPVQSDGRYRVYEIDLASAAGYRGAICRLSLEFAGSAATGEVVRRVRVRSIVGVGADADPGEGK